MKCLNCGKWAGVGRARHANCMHPEKATRAEEILMELPWFIQRGVYRGVLFTLLTMTGIWLVLGIIYAIATSK